MLKLKKLQILGFKSFCDRTELRFSGDGVAAIVGPNGCGKSNIADAITWVLGEQSAKSLRGSRMEDVIFAGTRNRKPTGMAEVTLTLVDPGTYDGPIDEEPEIEIRDDMPVEDWDEETIRAESAAEVEAYTEEVRPGQVDEVPAAEAPADAAQSTPAAAAGEGVASVESVAPSSSPASPESSVASGAAPEQLENQATAAGPENARAQVTAAPQVVLKIRRRKFNRTPLKKGEIVVTRRLFRSGESEYLLNHKLCRLRDIQDIFMGTGLGPESYAIIEQGRIGQILSSKPTDRRAIIEEAAGITKFKTKKRLAEARLEEAKLNLNRVNDIFEEVTRQMNSLKRQAAKAERYARLRDQMREKLRVVLASKFAALQLEKTQLEAELTAITEELHIRTDAVRQMESEQGERTQRGYEIETELRNVRQRLSEIALETDRATAKRRNNEERCAELDRRSEAARAELGQTQEKQATLEAEREQNRLTLQTAANDVCAAQQSLNTRQQEAQAAAATLANTEREQEQRRVAIMQAANDSANIRNRVTQAEENIASLERETQRLQSEIASANIQLESFGGERGQLTVEFESASVKVSSLAAQIAEARETLHAKRAAEADSKRRLDGLRAEFASLQGKRSSLEAVIAEHGYSTDSVRRLFQSGAMQNGFKPVGVLADFLEVEDRFEHVVDDFLRDELNYIVVKSWDAADHGLNLLRTDVDGRATFMVHPEDSQAKFSFTVDEAAAQAAAPRRDGIVPLKHAIRVLDGFGKSLEVILPKLRDGYIVPDAGVGRELALENPDAFFLSHSTGECFHNVTVTGGKQRAEGPLAMKRELRDVMRHQNELEHALRDEESKVGTLGREITEITTLIESLEAERRESEKQAMTSGHTLKQLDSEMERVRGRLATYERELARVGQEKAARQSFIAEKSAELARTEQRRAELEDAMASSQQELARLREARDAAALSASEVRAQVAALEERRRAAAQALQRIESLVAEVSGRVKALHSQIESAAMEKTQREAESVELGEKLIVLAAEREQAQVRESELQTETEQVRARLAELEEQLRAARESMDAARDRRGELTTSVARLETNAQHMTETSVAELGVTPTDLIADEAVLKVEGEALATEDAEYHELRAKLDNFGAVNMMALEEYNETSQRHTFLDTQRKDLLDSIANTQETIREIETISKQKFEEAFHAINDNFTRTFTKLFGGGQAFMKLTDEENSMESGIDVVASPPGKKLQNVLLLSGGEKALTALSLLVGIFQYQPSPFCILDEVDAPLDETNVGRFTELVREMSTHTQFILITHSKKTMSIAPVMYGVTMQEPGVSKLVSVRFNEAQAVASA
ncbi:MAG TPA: chromosome segregation protein SMC [Terriglobales bacterium]|nr:chromosome segregation protein SMC [Terriglobales bacterium]